MNIVWVHSGLEERVCHVDDASYFALGAICQNIVDTG
jgi:hypothetical protein